MGARAFAHLTTGIAQTEPGGTSYFTALEALLRCGITIFATWAKPLHVATTRIGGARARSRAEEADQSLVFRDWGTHTLFIAVLRAPSALGRDAAPAALMGLATVL